MPTENDKIEELDRFLKSEGIQHFSAREALHVNGHGVQPVPPQKIWGNIVGALKIADLLREAMGHALIIRHGFRPAEVNAAVGGKRRKPGRHVGSQHLYFRALDLQLPTAHASEQNQHKFYLEASKLYIRLGRETSMGLGLYRRNGWTRLHIDTGHKMRIWQKEHYQEWLKAARHALKHGDPDLATPQEPFPEESPTGSAPIPPELDVYNKRAGIGLLIAYGINIRMSRAHASTLREITTESADRIISGLGIELPADDETRKLLRLAVLEGIVNTDAYGQAVESIGKNDRRISRLVKHLEKSWPGLVENGETITLQDLNTAMEG